MSKCDVQIVFENDQRQFRSGETVTGEIIVQVSDAVKCNGLKLERYWQTHGRGNRDTGGRYTGTLFQGEWQPGVYRYPFKFTAPAMPLTYRGHYLNIDHYVHARVDIPWAFDPKSTEEFIVVPGEGGSIEAPATASSSPTAPSGDSKGGVVVAIIMMVAGLIFFPCAIVLVPLGVAIMIYSMRNSIAEKKVGEVLANISSNTVEPGGTINIGVSVGKPDAKINGVSMKLIGREVCVSGSGTNKTTHKHTLHEHQEQLALIPRAGQLTAQGSLQVPPTNAFSFSASDNKITWEVEVRVDVPNWPDWVQTQPLVIRPTAMAAKPHTPVGGVIERGEMDIVGATADEARGLRDQLPELPKVDPGDYQYTPKERPARHQRAAASQTGHAQSAQTGQGQSSAFPPPLVSSSQHHDRPADNPTPPPHPSAPLAAPATPPTDSASSDPFADRSPLDAWDTGSAGSAATGGAGMQGIPDAPKTPDADQLVPSIESGDMDLSTSKPSLDDALPDVETGDMGIPGTPKGDVPLPEVAGFGDAAKLAEKMATDADSGGTDAGSTDGAATSNMDSGVGGLLGVAERFKQADRFSGEHKQIVAELEGQTFSFTVNIEKVDNTFGFSMPDEYRNGRTVVGKLSNGTPVSVKFPQSRNEELDALKSGGGSIDTQATLVEWNTLYDRPEMEATA